MQPWLALAASLPLSVAAAVAGTALDRSPAPAPHQDRDGDKVFDDLEAALRGQPSWSRHGVIVMLHQAPTPERMAALAAYAGPFAITSDEGQPWTIVPAFAATLTKWQVERLAAHPLVHFIEPDVTFYAD